MTSSGRTPNQNHTKAAQRRRQLVAIAQDRRARGDNPVTVSDLRQRHGVGNTPGRGFLSTLLRRS
jgi:uncharacterized protein (DUF2252 family)